MKDSSTDKHRVRLKKVLDKRLPYSHSNEITHRAFQKIPQQGNISNCIYTHQTNHKNTGWKRINDNGMITFESYSFFKHEDGCYFKCILCNSIVKESSVIAKSGDYCKVYSNLNGGHHRIRAGKGFSCVIEKSIVEERVKHVGKTKYIHDDSVFQIECE